MDSPGYQKQEKSTMKAEGEEETGNPPAPLSEARPERLGLPCLTQDAVHASALGMAKSYVGLL